MTNLEKLLVKRSGHRLYTVWDVTWMSDQSVHLAKWMAVLEQVTVRHLAKCPHQLVKCHLRFVPNS